MVDSFGKVTAASEAMGASIETTSQKVVAGGASVNSTLKRWDDLTSAQAKLDAASKGLANTQNLLTIAQDNGSDKVDGLTRALANQQGNVAALQAKLDGVKTALGSSVSAMDDFGGSVSKAAQKIGDLGASVDELRAIQTVLNELNGTKLGTNLASYANDIASTANALSSLRASVDKVYASSMAYEGQLAKVDALEATNALTAQRATAIREELTAAFAKGSSAVGADTEILAAATAAAKENADAQAAVTAEVERRAEAVKELATSTAAGQASANAYAGVTVTPNSNQGGTNAQEENEEAWNEATAAADRQRSAVDSLFAASKQYEAGLQSLNSLRSTGVIPTDELLLSLTQKLTEAYSAANSVTAMDAINQKASADAAEANAAAQRDVTAEVQRRADATKAAAQLTATTQSNVAAFVSVGSTTNTAGIGDSAAEAALAANFKAADDAANQLRASLDPLYATTMRYEQALEGVNNLLAIGKIDDTQATLLKQDQANAYAKLIAQQNAYGTSTGQTSYLVRNLGIQASQSVSGLLTGQGILTVFLQQGHQMVDVFLASGDAGNQLGAVLGKLAGFLANPIVLFGALTAAIGALGYMAESKQASLALLAQGLQGVSSNATALAKEITDAAKAASQANFGLSNKDALASATTIGSVSDFTGTQAQLTALVELAAKVSRAIGEDLPAASKTLADAMTDPAAAVATLVNKVQGITPAFAQAVKDMQASGDTAGATSLLFNKLNDGIQGTGEKLTPFQQAVRNATEALKPAKQAVDDYGKSLGDLAVDAVTNALNRLAAGLTKFQQQAKQAAAENTPQLGLGGDPEFVSSSSATTSVATTSAATTSTTVSAGVTAEVQGAARDALLIAASNDKLSDAVTHLGLQMTTLESSGNQISPVTGKILTSSAGALGAYQVMPSIASAYGGDPNTLSGGAQDMVAFLKDLDKHYNGNLSAIAAAYNMGETKFQVYLNGLMALPAETVKYVTNLGLPLPQTTSQQRAAAAAGTAVNNSGALSNTTTISGDTTTASAMALPVVSGDAIESYKKASQNVDLLTKALTDGNNTDAQTATLQQGLRLAVEQLVPPTQKAAQAATDQATANNNLSPAMRQMNKDALDATNQMRSTGAAQVDQAALTQTQKAHLDELSQSFAQGTAAISDNTIGLRASALAFDGSASSLGEATNHAKAFQAAQQSFLPGSQELTDATNLRTEALQKESAAQQDLTTLQGMIGQGTQLTALAAETAEVSKGVDARTRELAVLQARLAITARNGDADDAASQKFLANVAKITDAQNNLNRAKMAQDETTSSKNDLAVLQLESSTLGQNEDLRQREITLLQTKQKLQAAGFVDGAADTQQYLAQVDAVTKASQAYATQKANLDELTSFATNAFQTVGNSITQALENGSLKALNFGTIMKSVLAQIVTEFGKLAILDPILNSLFGQNTPTLGGVAGTLLGLGSSAASAADPFAGAGNSTGADSSSGGGGLGKDASILGLAGKGASYLFPETTAAVTDYVANVVDGAIGTSFGSVATAAADPFIEAGGAVASAASTGADVFAGVGTSVAAAAEGATAAGDAASGAASAATAASASASTLGSYIPFVGAALGVVTNILTGNYIGAAAVAIGAAIGTIILPGVGTAIGTVVGSIVSLFTGPKKKNSFESTDVGSTDGFLTLSNVQQQANKDTSNFNNLVTAAGKLNTDLANTGIRLAGGDNENMFNVGYGVKNDKNFYDSLGDAFPALRFKAADTDNDTYKQVANAKLDGVSFTGQDTLDAAIKQVQDFATTLEQYGVTVSNVQKDLAGFTVAHVSGYTDPNLNTALDTDLAGKTFTSAADLQTEIQKVQTFVVQTMPSLISATGDAQSQFQEQQADIDSTYGAAITQAKAYGLSIDALAATQAKLQAKLLATAAAAVQANDNTYVSRIDKDQGDTLDSSLIDFDAQATQQRQALHDLFVSYYGEASLTTQDYLTQQTHLETALGQERLQIQTDYNAQIAAAAAQQSQAIRGIDETVSKADTDNLRADAAVKGEATYGPDYEQADLIDFDNSAYDQTQKLSQDMIATYGASVVNSAGYAKNMGILEMSLGNQRLAIQKKYSDEATTAAVQAAQTQAAAVKQAQDTATQSAISSVTSLQQYAVKLQTGSQSALDPNNQYAVASKAFNAVAGSALKGNAQSISSLSSYADTLLSTSQTVNGSGTQYAADFQRVLGIIGQISQEDPDTLTATIYAQEQETLRQQLVDALADVKTAVDQVKTQIQQQAAAPKRVAA